ncbi:uncharacterized protein [Typha latifolia]|uniref:uncharacterized protein n=1 Tax=Typha latifolia TaxID=4733 RepID=UPI003C2DD4AC
MSGEKGDLYHHYNPLFQADRDYFSDLSLLFSQRPGSTSSVSNDLPGTDAPSASLIDYHGLIDYGALARAFDVPCSSSDDPFSLRDGAVKRQELAVDTNCVGGNNLTESAGGDASAAPITPNSSVSWSSTEAAGEEDSGRCKKDQMKQEEEGEEEKQQVKVGDEGGDKSKKVSKPKSKGEKRQRQPRFAFVTKSEVDHLEDGYRWRKYGQKAVKNSPYPRSYYRCTTQKCSVKKRVERSYQDPSIVITTYEGQHTHQSPATLRGSAHILPPPPPAAVPAMRQSFLQDLLVPQVSHPMQQMQANPNVYLPTLPPSTLQQLQFPDYGLLQDIVPSFMQHSHQP